MDPNKNMSASNKNTNLDDAKGLQHKQQQVRPQQQPDFYHQPQLTGMTPSIITTINNTSPHPPEDNYPSLNYNNNNCNTATRHNRRTNEPYESYIEDSFVGHWEREDDDTNYHEYAEGGRRGLTRDGNDEDENSALQNASTIEFDFDSFGPESIIYTPPTIPPSTTSTTTTTTTNTTKITTISEAPATANNISIPTNHGELDNGKEAAKQCSSVINVDTSRAKVREVNPTPQQTQIFPSALATNSSDYLVDSTQIDLKVIEPYKKVISHAGYCHPSDPSAPPPKPGEQAPAVIVFSACYLPDRSRRDYNYVMDHLFLYVLTSLHELIADDYVLIYLHNTQPSRPSVNATSNNLTNSSSTSSTGNGEEIQHPNNLPTFTWIKRCYQIIDRKLRKNLKILYLVKPTFWLKTIVIMCKPFISSKFSRKLRFVENMDELKKCLPVDRLILPASADNI